MSTIIQLDVACEASPPSFLPPFYFLILSHPHLSFPLYIFHSLFSDSCIFISSLIRTVFDLLSLVAHTHTHHSDTDTTFEAVTNWSLNIRAHSELCSKPLAANPHTHMHVQRLPIAPVPVRKVCVGPDNKRTLAVRKRAAIMSHWGGIGRRGRIFYVTTVGWWQQHQIGEEAPALKRLKSICTPECVKLANAHHPAKKEYRKKKTSQAGKCLKK